MSDHTALWLLFILLSVLFVLVVITARRGPWGQPVKELPQYVIGFDPARSEDDACCIVLLRKTRDGLEWVDATWS